MTLQILGRARSAGSLAHSSSSFVVGFGWSRARRKQAWRRRGRFALGRKTCVDSSMRCLWSKMLYSWMNQISEKRLTFQHRRASWIINLKVLPSPRFVALPRSFFEWFTNSKKKITLFAKLCVMTWQKKGMPFKENTRWFPDAWFFLAGFSNLRKIKTDIQPFFLIIVGVALKGNSGIRMLLRCERDQTGNWSAMSEIILVK